MSLYSSADCLVPVCAAYTLPARRVAKRGILLTLHAATRYTVLPVILALAGIILLKLSPSSSAEPVSGSLLTRGYRKTLEAIHERPLADIEALSRAVSEGSVNELSRILPEAGEVAKLLCRTWLCDCALRPGFVLLVVSLVGWGWVLVSPVLDELEVLVRALGLVYARTRDAILVEVEEGGRRIGVAITYDELSDVVRIAAPLDVEPLPEALSWFLEESFKSTTYKYTIDYDGFVTVVYDLPRRCLRTARDVREAILQVVEGAKRVLERVVEEGGSGEEGG